VFPDNYSAKHLVGKEASFIVKINNIVRKTPAEIDDDLALMAGFLNVEELNEDVANTVNKGIELFNHRDAEGKIIKELFESNDLTIPQTLISDEARSILTNYNLDNPSDEIMSKIQMAAENNVKKNMLLNAIYNKEDDIELPLDELSDALEEQAQASDKTKDEMVSFLYNTGQMEDFVGVLRGKKVIEYIIGLNEGESNE